jgi:YegS/Rv2252/BmrU family lipid kinase
MFPKTQVIVNPESNKGRTRRRWRQIKEVLHNHIKEFRYEFTEKPLQAIEMTREAIKSGSELIIGVGGDGTMNEIANGFFENTRMINPETTLGIVPSGTGCDLIKSLNIPAGLNGSMKVITEAGSACIDVGRASFTNNEGGPEERFFLNVADFGLGGEVIREVNRKRLERKASSYFRCLYTAFIHYKHKRLSLKLDGRELADEDYMIGAIANGRVFGKGMKISPEAKLDDGLFDVVVIKSMKMFEFLKNSLRVYRGTHLSHPKVSLMRCRRIEAVPVTGQEVLIELDGEQIGRLPATFEVIPQHLLVKSNL